MVMIERKDLEGFGVEKMFGVPSSPRLPISELLGRMLGRLELFQCGCVGVGKNSGQFPDRDIMVVGVPENKILCKPSSMSCC